MQVVAGTVRRVPAPGYLVLIPYYAGPELLTVTLRSVIAQTDRGWRCIVVDDSPADDAGPVVRALGDSRIRCRRNRRTLGVAGNFQRCFDIARTEGATLAVVLHADDVLEPEYVAAMKRAHQARPDAVCVVPRVTVIGARGSRTRTLPDTVKELMWPRRLGALAGEQGLRLLLRGQFFHCPAVSYRMALLGDHRWDQRWRQVMDLDLYARLLLDDGVIVLERRRLFRYRRHEGSMTQVNSATLLRTQEETRVCRELATLAAERGWRRAARAGEVRLAVRLHALLRVVMLLRLRRYADARRAAALAVRR